MHALLQAWTSSLLTFGTPPHQPCIPLTLGAGGGACRKPSVWAAVALSPGGLASCAVALFAALGAARRIDSLIMKCGICGSQIMVLILARDTTHLAVRVLSSSVPAPLPINWLEGA